MRLTAVSVLLALAIGLDPSAQAAGVKEFTAADLLSLKRIANPQASSDGRRVAFVVRETDLDANRVSTAVWMLDLASRPAVAKRVTRTAASEWSPRWAADGRSLYFLSSRSGSAQVWQLAIDSGETRQVTDYPLDVASFRLSLDGTRIAMTLQVWPECDTLRCTADRLAAARKATQATGQQYDALFVRHWDSWSDGRLSMLFTAMLRPESGAGEPLNVSRSVPASITAQLGGGEEYEFSPDGSRLVFSARLAHRDQAWSTNFDLYDVPADGNGAARNLTERNPAWDAQPVMLANGDLAYLAMTRPGFEADRFRIMVRDGRTGSTRALAQDWDRSVKRLAASRDGRGLLATADDKGQSSLFSVDARSGQVKRVVGQGQVTEFSPLPDGSVLVAWGSLAASPDLFIATDEAEPLRRLTRLNADVLGRRSLGEFEQFTFPGWNDEPVHGYVVKPAGFEANRRYPIAFIVHGGPQSSFQNQWSWRWNAQTFAARGYAVIMIDFHGSPGYGQRFTDSISRDWGGKPLVDLHKGLEAALARYQWLDGERACSLGASYGGYMQNWIAVSPPQRFKCLVNHAGVFDTRMGAYATDELWFTEWDFGGTYYENPSGHEQFNPASLVTKWRTPTLMTYGALDYRVPYLHGLAAFTALQRLGVESRLLYFPDENHWILKPANALQWHQAIFEWLDRYLQPSSQRAAELPTT